MPKDLPVGLAARMNFCSLRIQRGQVIPRALGNLPGPRRTAKGLLRRINRRLLCLPAGEHGEFEARHVFEEPRQAERLLDVQSIGDRAVAALACSHGLIVMSS